MSETRTTATTVETVKIIKFSNYFTSNGEEKIEQGDKKERIYREDLHLLLDKLSFIFELMKYNQPLSVERNERTATDGNLVLR